MKASRWIVTVTSLVVLSLGFVLPSAAKPRPSTAEDRAKAVVLTRQLEADPFSANAAEARRWLLIWLERVPDISVTVRPLLGPIPGDDHQFSAEILVQMIFSNAAHAIEHPEEAKDEIALQTAGVQGALRVYEAILRNHPDTRIDFLDDLVRKRNEGRLSDYVRESLPQPKRK